MQQCQIQTFGQVPSLGMTMAAGLFCAAAVLFGPVSDAVAQTKTAERTISVSATGKVKADPDIAQISVGVVTQEETAEVAMSSNAKRMAKVVDALKRSGIEERDIGTEEFRVAPIYENYKSLARSQTPKVIGYRVFNSVRVRVTRVTQTGKILDAAVKRGANQIGAIQFLVSGLEKRLDEARADAMANAIRRAKLYAQAAGASLGAVISISENVRGGPRPIARTRVASARVATPISPGQQTYQVQVHVKWTLE